MIAIRRLGPDDWVLLRRVRLAALSDAPGNFFRTLAEEEPKPPEHWQTMLDDQSGAIFGLFDAETIIGLTGVFTDRDDPTGATAALGMTWLAPLYRERGLSALFYRERIAWARSGGHARIVVGHRASNGASRAAMRRAGFRRVGTKPHRWPDGVEEDEHLYQLPLDQDKGA